MESNSRRPEGRRNRDRNGLITNNGNQISILELLMQQKTDNQTSADLLTDSFGESSSSQNDILQTSSDSSNHFHTTFSSRNSLRSARTKDNPIDNKIVHPIQKNSPTNKDMLNHIHEERIRNLTNQFGLEYPGNHEPFHGSSFIKIIGGFFYCILCNERRRMNRSDDVDNHLNCIPHCERLRQLRAEIVEQIPDNDSLHMRSVSILLENWLFVNSLTTEKLEERFYIIDEFSRLLQEINPECHCRLFGSLLDGTSLIDSNINLELLHPNSCLFESDPRAKNSIHHKLIDPSAEYGNQFNQHMVHYDMIENASDTLYKTGISIIRGYTSINSFKVTSTLWDINSKVPRLNLIHEPTGVSVEVCCYTGISHKLSTLLNIYLSLDPRAAQLCKLVKYWAKLCDICSADKGTYASDTYIIMVIYFLQAVQPPILPCLHDIVKSARSDSVSQELDENTLSSQFNQLDIKNSTVSKNQPTTSGQDQHDGQPQVGEQLNDPVAEEVDDEGDESDIGDEISPDILDTLNWQSSNTDPVHKLFIEFLREMWIELGDRETVISIRTLKRVTLESKTWNTSVKAIEHPIKPKLNISRCIGLHRTYEYIRNCFKCAFFYLTSMPIKKNLKLRRESQQDPTDYVDLYTDIDRLDFYFRMKESSIKNGPKKNSTITEMVNQKLFTRDVEVIHKLLEYVSSNNLNINQLPKTLAGMYDLKLLVAGDKQAATYCWLCRRNGHKKSECPKAKPMDLQDELSKYDAQLDYRANLDDAFYELYVRDLITPELTKKHNQVREALAYIIKSATGLNCRLQLFGSTVNCLGTCDSDLDICMTIEGNLTGKGIDCVKILGQVLKVLEQREEVQEMEPVLAARVPILKFKFNQFCVDLSMYNLCALHNSRLLRTYVLIDNRVAKLSYLVKRYAKACKIADASRGSLSSYAWSLMVIHFLQQIQPPILPVLQETTDKTVRPIGVGGWNVWFNSDTNNLRMEPNRLTLTELFKQFFLYYGTFDFNQYVISIRKLAKISKFKKNWNNCMMAIEDPFELTYNLSSRLDDAMAIYIINSFARAYKHITHVQNRLLNSCGALDEEHMMSSLFSLNGIMGNNQPPVRGCRLCHRIGHRYKDCPDLARNQAGRARRVNEPNRRPA